MAGARRRLLRRWRRWRRFLQRDRLVADQHHRDCCCWSRREHERKLIVCVRVYCDRRPDGKQHQRSRRIPAVRRRWWNRNIDGRNRRNVFIRWPDYHKRRCGELVLYHRVIRRLRWRWRWLGEWSWRQWRRRNWRRRQHRWNQRNKQPWWRWRRRWNHRKPRRRRWWFWSCDRQVCRFFS